MTDIPLPLKAASAESGVSLIQISRWIISGTIVRYETADGHAAVRVKQLLAVVRRKEEARVKRARPLREGECWMRRHDDGSPVWCVEWRGVFPSCGEGHPKCR